MAIISIFAVSAWAGGGSPRFGAGKQSPGTPRYLWDELKQGVGVERANGQGYEVEEQPLVKGFPHEGHHTGPQQGAQGDDRDAQEPITPN